MLGKMAVQMRNNDLLGLPIDFGDKIKLGFVIDLQSWAVAPAGQQEAAGQLGSFTGNGEKFFVTCCHHAALLVPTKFICNAARSGLPDTQKEILTFAFLHRGFLIWRVACNSPAPGWSGGWAKPVGPIEANTLGAKRRHLRTGFLIAELALCSFGMTPQRC